MTEKEYAKQYRIKNKDRVNKSKRDWVKRNRDKVLKRKSEANKRYRESGKIYEYLGFQKPTRPKPETCEICEKPASGKAMHYDHCHASNTFRGWLCQNCNRGLGMFFDSPDLLEKAKQYIKDDRFKNK